MRWLPRLDLMSVCTLVGECKPDSAEAHGYVLQLAWLGLVIEFTLAGETQR